MGGTREEGHFAPVLWGRSFFVPPFSTKGMVSDEGNNPGAAARALERELQAAQNSDAVEKLRIAYLGKKGSVTELLKGLKSVAGDQKKENGPAD